MQNEISFSTVSLTFATNGSSTRSKTGAASQ